MAISVICCLRWRPVKAFYTKPQIKSCTTWGRSWLILSVYLLDWTWLSKSSQVLQNSSLWDNQLWETFMQSYKVRIQRQRRWEEMGRELMENAGEEKTTLLSLTESNICKGDTGLKVSQHQKHISFSCRAVWSVISAIWSYISGAFVICFPTICHLNSKSEQQILFSLHKSPHHL